MDSAIFRTWLKNTIFSIVPMVVLLLTAEVIVRTVLQPTAHYQTLALPEEGFGLHIPDLELFWRNPRNFATTAYGKEVHTNRYGLRGPDFPLQKGPNEYRILMIGESTTFGAGVSDNETYSAVLQQILNKRGGHPVQVINAGISAYSSFQSLLYLKTEGLSFSPDLVVIYSELNDYLPTSIRNSGNTEVGTSMSDVDTHGHARGTSHRSSFA